MYKFLVVLILSVSAFASDPVIFRGAYIGESLSDFADCASGKAKAVKDGYKAHGKLCEGKGGIVYRTRTKGIMSMQTEGEVLKFEDMKLVEIKIMMPSQSWEKARFDLTAKLGQPYSEAPAVFQNAFGARWEFKQGFWSNGEVVAAARIRPPAMLGGEMIDSPSLGGPIEQVEIVIMDAVRAKRPSTTPSSLD